MSDPRGARPDPGEAAQREKRARILRAALELCTRDGVAATRMEQVAMRARVSKGTLYRFFDSREDLLLEALLASQREGMHRALAALGAPADDPRAQLARLCDGLVDALRVLGARASVHAQMWTLVAGTPAFEARLLAALRSFSTERHAACEALVRAGQASGAFRDTVSPSAVADALGALLEGFAQRASFDPSRASPEALRACLDALVIGALESDAAQRSRETSGRL